MPQLPGPDAVGPTPNAFVRTGIASYDTTAIGRGVQQFGQGVSNLGAGIQQQVDKQQAYDSTTKWNDFESTWRQKAADASKDMAPGGGGTLETFTPAYQQAANKFAATLPAAEQEKYKPVIHAFEGQLTGALTGQVRQEQIRFAVDQQGQRTDAASIQVASNPGNVDLLKQQMEKQRQEIQINPNIPPIEKQQKIEALETDFAKKIGPAWNEARPVSDAIQKTSDLPAGMQNNNPGNLKFSANAGAYPGVVGPSKNLDQGDPQIVFATAGDGMKAAVQLARQKYGQGMTTADQIIAGQGGWTPGNKQAAANIAATMGVKPGDDLKLDSPDRMAQFMRAVVTQEHGPASKAYSDDMIQSAVTGGKDSFGNPVPPKVAGFMRPNYANVGNMGDPRSSGWASQNLTQIQAGNGQAWTVNKQAAEAFQGFFKDLEAEGYSPQSSGGYNLRTIAGSSVLSQHAWGNAIDINALVNKQGQRGNDLPANVGDLAAKWGLVWGGNFRNKPDPMHFEWAGPNGAGGAAPPPRAPDPFGQAYSYWRGVLPNASPEALDGLARGAIAARNSFAVQDRIGVDNAANDALAALNNTGNSTGAVPTQDDFARAYGPQGLERYQAFQAASEVAKATYGMRFASDASIQAQIDAAQPRLSGDGAAAETQRYAAMKQAGEEIIKRRHDDPAAYVDQFPDVQQAKQAADIGRPETFAPLVAARMSAQAALGIPASLQSPMSLAEAQQFSTVLKQALPGKEKETLHQVTATMQALYGPHTDAAVAYMLSQAKFDAPTKAITASMFRKLGIGQVPTPQEARQFDDATKVQAADQAVAGVLAPQQKGFPVPTSQALQYLRANPGTAQQFDDKFGPGRAAQILQFQPAAPTAALSPNGFSGDLGPKAPVVKLPKGVGPSPVGQIQDLRATDTPDAPAGLYPGM